MDDETNKPPDAPALHSFEGGLFGALFGFHKRVMALLRAANLDDGNVRIAGERIHLLIEKATEEIKRTRDLNIQPRLDSMYEEVQRLVDELSERDTMQDQMEEIYSETPPADIPWNIESPPKALVELVKGGQVQPCKTIEMGCGAGNYAIYLASVGFDVTGVDISPSAIALAETNARQKGVTCKFVAADVPRHGAVPEILREKVARPLCPPIPPGLAPEHGPQPLLSPLYHAGAFRPGRCRRRPRPPIESPTWGSPRPCPISILTIGSSSASCRFR
jgi:hypothetical protein